MEQKCLKQLSRCDVLNPKNMYLEICDPRFQKIEKILYIGFGALAILIGVATGVNILL